VEAEVAEEEAVAEVEAEVEIITIKEEADQELSKELSPIDIIHPRSMVPSHPKICLDYLTSGQHVTPQEVSAQSQLAPLLRRKVN
jgi:hypothetical protein